MDASAWATLAVLGLVVVLLVFTRRAPDGILMGGLTLLMVLPVPDGSGQWRLGIIQPTEALSGLANPGLVTVGVLFVVAAGLRETGGMTWLVQRLLGHPRSTSAAQVRTMLPVAGMSAFLNNTPVVALFIPIMVDWANKLRISPSKLLLPLSYAAILGGTCTLIGTSTNLVVNGLLMERTGSSGLGMFEIAWIGLPSALVGIAYVLVFGRWVLPDRRPPISLGDDPRQYTVEMLVEAGSSLEGRSIEQAGLRHLVGTYLMEIVRGDQVLAAVGPAERLQGGDRLIFVGIVDSVRDLRRIRGLKPATDQVFKLDSPREHRCLVEAVVSNSCPLVGRTIKQGRFRAVYNAVVIAVARNGERLAQKIGQIRLRPGDTLLLETTPDFHEQQHNRRDFYLVSEVAESATPRHERAGIALTILGAMVAAATLGWLTMLQAVMVAAGAMLLFRCIDGAQARRSVDWSVLVVIGASFGFGRALEETGAARHMGELLIGLAGSDPWLTLVLVYAATTLFTEMITNNAAALLVFPIAMAAAENLGVDHMPFVVAVMVAASASFSSPLGYQTNLMVYGPGGYRFTDYLRAGIPLNLVVWAMTIFVAPRVWPF